MLSPTLAPKAEKWKQSSTFVPRTTLEFPAPMVGQAAVCQGLSDE